MKSIAIFYHIYLGGGSIPCDPENVTQIVTEQLSALHASGLAAAAQHIEIGVSGSEYDAFMVQSMAPNWKVTHNKVGVGELPTMKLMQDFCKHHPDWYVLYFHTKGAIYKGHAAVTAWRECMEDVVIWRWQSCVSDLESGFVDSCGCHWLKPSQYPIIGSVPYWGGNFFWARSALLNTCPPIDINADRYQAEVWIGKGRRARVRDYAMHWPGAHCIR